MLLNLRVRTPGGVRRWLKTGHTMIIWREIWEFFDILSTFKSKKPREVSHQLGVVHRRSPLFPVSWSKQEVKRAVLSAFKPSLQPFISFWFFSPTSNPALCSGGFSAPREDVWRETSNHEEAHYRARFCRSPEGPLLLLLLVLWPLCLFIHESRHICGDFGISGGIENEFLPVWMMLGFAAHGEFVITQPPVGLTAFLHF